MSGTWRPKSDKKSDKFWLLAFFWPISCWNFIKVQDIVNTRPCERFQVAVTIVTPATPICNTGVNKIEKFPKYSRTGWDGFVFIPIVFLPTLATIGPLERPKSGIPEYKTWVEHVVPKLSQKWEKLIIGLFLTNFVPKLYGGPRYSEYPSLWAISSRCYNCDTCHAHM